MVNVDCHVEIWRADGEFLGFAETSHGPCYGPNHHPDEGSNPDDRRPAMFTAFDATPFCGHGEFLEQAVARFVANRAAPQVRAHAKETAP